MYNTNIRNKLLSITLIGSITWHSNKLFLKVKQMNNRLFRNNTLENGIWFKMWYNFYDSLNRKKKSSIKTQHKFKYLQMYVHLKPLNAVKSLILISILNPLPPKNIAVF